MAYGYQVCGTLLLSVCHGISGFGQSDCVMSLVCRGLEEVLGVKLPQDLSTDEARDTLAKLVHLHPHLLFLSNPHPCRLTHAPGPKLLPAALHCATLPCTV